MEFLFANNLERTGLKPKVNPPVNLPSTPSPLLGQPKRIKRLLIVLLEQCINSTIVAGIASFSVWAANLEVGWKPPIIAFGITFFTELRKYRKL